jgi:regulator of sirC expression with transglutaminase-like and TPR domain
MNRRHGGDMSANRQLPDWNALAECHDADLPLLETALLIARDEYPSLDPGAYLAEIDGHARRLEASLAPDLDIPSKLTAINHFLYRELGFSGNQQQYDDPRNSYLNEVFDRRLGIPITLAVVHIELMRRLGLALEGISFPGHYLVRLPVDGGIVVMDPFNQGRPIGFEELRQRATSHMQGGTPTDAQLIQILEPASSRVTLMRMLRNLQSIYQARDDFERTARCADRILKLAPDQPEALRDRGMAYAQLGHSLGARADLGRYLALRPDAADAETVRIGLIDASLGRSALN